MKLLPLLHDDLVPCLDDLCLDLRHVELHAGLPHRLAVFSTAPMNTSSWIPGGRTMRLTSFACSCKVWPNWVFKCRWESWQQPTACRVFNHALLPAWVLTWGIGCPITAPSLVPRGPDPSIFPPDAPASSFASSPNTSYRLRQHVHAGVGEVVALLVDVGVFHSAFAPCRSSIGPRRALPRRPPHSPP